MAEPRWFPVCAWPWPFVPEIAISFFFFPPLSLWFSGHQHNTGLCGGREAEEVEAFLGSYVVPYVVPYVAPYVVPQPCGLFMWAFN